MKQKKLTKKSFNRKMILLGFMIFASIALISTGFAAFVISQGATTTAPLGNVTIGEIEDGSLAFDNISLSNTMFSFQPILNDNEGRVQWKQGDGSENLTITLTGTLGPVDHVASATVTLTIPETVKNAAQNNYIVLPSCVNGADLPLEDKDEDGVYEFTYDIRFEWGSAFGGVNPSAYYDDAGKDVSFEEMTTTLNAFYQTMYGTANPKNPDSALSFKIDLKATAK